MFVAIQYRGVFISTSEKRILIKSITANTKYPCEREERLFLFIDLIGWNWFRLIECDQFWFDVLRSICINFEYLMSMCLRWLWFVYVSTFYVGIHNWRDKCQMFCKFMFPIDCFRKHRPNAFIFTTFLVHQRKLFNDNTKCLRYLLHPTIGVEVMTPVCRSEWNEMNELTPWFNLNSFNSYTPKQSTNPSHVNEIYCTVFYFHTFVWPNYSNANNLLEQFYFYNPKIKRTGERRLTHQTIIATIN